MITASLALHGCGEQVENLRTQGAALGIESKNSNSSDQRGESGSPFENGGTNGNGNSGGEGSGSGSQGLDSSALRITDISSGLQSLLKGQKSSRAFEEVRIHGFIDSKTRKDIIAAIKEEHGDTINDRFQKKFLIKHWYKHASGSCKYHVQFEDDQGKLYASKDRVCKEQERLGLQKCDRMDTEYLGLKDIGTFKLAWGVRIRCEGTFKSEDINYSTMQGYKYLTIRETWFHQDSNHFQKKIEEGRIGFIETPGQMTIAQQIASDSPVKAFWTVYKNRDPIGTVDKDFTPPQVSASYRLTGAVEKPGIYTSFAKCRRSIYDSSKLGSIQIQRLFIDEDNKAGPGIKRMAGIWKPNFVERPQPGSGGAVVGGLFTNKGWNDSYFETGSYNISVSKYGDSDYLRIRVTRPNSPITLVISRYTSPARRYAYVDQISDIYCILSGSTQATTVDAWGGDEY